MSNCEPGNHHFHNDECIKCGISFDAATLEESSQDIVYILYLLREELKQIKSLLQVSLDKK